MNFCPKDLCEKLVALGCKSISCAYWVEKSWGDDIEHGKQGMPFDVPAFTLEDFVANTEQAKENARNVWGTGIRGYSVPNDAFTIIKWLEPSDWNRHQMIDAPDPWKFLSETMRKE